MKQSKFLPHIKTCLSPINQLINIPNDFKIQNNTHELQFSNFKKNCNKVEKNMKREPGKLTQRFTERRNSSGEKWIKYCTLQPLVLDNQNQISDVKKKCKEEKIQYSGRKEVIKMLQNSPYSRYKLMQLFSLYNTLLSFCQHNPKKFLQGFEAQLNYQRINIKSELLQRHIKSSKDLSFESFINIYKKIEDLMFIQSVVDYIQILFESSGLKDLRIDDIKETFGKRCSKEKADEISEQMFFRLRKSFTQTIKISEIYTLCEKDFIFCGKLAQLYYKQIKGSTQQKK